MKFFVNILNGLLFLQQKLQHICSTKPPKKLNFPKWSYVGANDRDCYNALRFLVHLEISLLSLSSVQHFGTKPQRAVNWKKVKYIRMAMKYETWCGCSSVYCKGKYSERHPWNSHDCWRLYLFAKNNFSKSIQIVYQPITNLILVKVCNISMA